MRTMYDGIDSDAAAIAQIPSAIGLVAGYVDGDYAWSAAEWALFPNSVHVPIAVKSTTNAGIVLDVENGDATPAESVDWVLLRRAAGADPSVYCNTTTWPAVVAEFKARAVPLPHWWAAQYDGIATLPVGAVAKQYASTARWDLSCVADYWPGVDDPAPTTPAAPAASLEEEDMFTTSINGRAGLPWAAGSKHIIQVNYHDAGVTNFALDVELKFESGSWYAPEPWVPVKGSGVWRIPDQLKAACRGVILSWHAGSEQITYDAYVG